MQPWTSLTHTSHGLRRLELLDEVVAVPVAATGPVPWPETGGGPLKNAWLFGYHESARQTITKAAGIRDSLRRVRGMCRVNQTPVCGWHML